MPWTYDLDGIEIDFEIDSVAYGSGGFVDGFDCGIEITHIDGVEVGGPFTLIFDYADPWPTASESRSLTEWIAENTLEAA